MLYLNHAGTSWPKPAAVLEAVASASSAEPARQSELIDGARATICRFFGIPRPDRFLFTSSCTQALSVVLGDLVWRPGDVVLTSSVEHHAMMRPIDALTQVRGVVHEAIPYHPSAPLDPALLEARLQRGGVKLVAVTAASNVTGELLPIEDIVELAHRYGALCLVDAAQTAGIVPIDVSKVTMDLMTFAGHKGPLGPHGIAGFWASTRVAFRCLSAVCEVGASPGSSRETFPGYCDVGSVNVAGASGLAAGLRRQNSGTLGASARDLRASLRRALLGRTGCRVYGGDGPATAALSFQLQGVPLRRTEELFARRGIVVRVGHHCAPAAMRALGTDRGTLRVSFGVEQGSDALDALLSVVDELVETASRR